MKAYNDWVATIGFFDGVHRGHRHLIDNVISVARQAGMGAMVITFRQHPRKVLQADYIPQVLNTTEEKLHRLETTGVDRVEALDFDLSLAQLSAQEFMAEVMKQRLNVKKLVIGYDNRFGHNREDDFDDYVRYGKELGIEVIRSDVFEIGGHNISSSYIRRLLAKGEVSEANKCLGYNYRIKGTVVDGDHMGRKLGFPTANILAKSQEKMLPMRGAYAVRATIGDLKDAPAMMNIGIRPTFGGREAVIEVNVFDFDGDLYGKQLTIEMVEKLREERPFNDVKELINQLKRDQQRAINILNTP